MENGHVASEPESIYDALKRSYLQLSREYAPFVFRPEESKHQQPSTELSTDDNTTNALSRLPREVVPRVLDFARDLTSYISDGLIAEKSLLPTSDVHLRAIVANIYLKEKISKGDKIDEDMYVRVLASLYGGSFSSNASFPKDTDQLINEFIKDEFNRKGFYNFVIQLACATQPIGNFDTEKADDEYAKFKHFYQRLQQLQVRPRAVLKQIVQETLPEAAKNVTQDKYPVIYVGEISRGAPVTNDYKINQRKTYNELSAQAIT